MQAWQINALSCHIPRSLLALCTDPSGTNMKFVLGSARLTQSSDINTETQQEVRHLSVTGSATSSLRMQEVLLGGQ